MSCEGNMIGCMVHTSPIFTTDGLTFTIPKRKASWRVRSGVAEARPNAEARSVRAVKARMSSILTVRELDGRRVDEMDGVPRPFNDGFYTLCPTPTAARTQ